MLFRSRRKNNYDWENIKNSVNKFSSDSKDITVNKIENIFSKYVKYVWKNISFNDYVSIFKKKINDKISNHEIYKEYKKLKLNKIYAPQFPLHPARIACA